MINLFLMNFIQERNNFEEPNLIICKDFIENDESLNLLEDLKKVLIIIY